MSKIKKDLIINYLTSGDQILHLNTESLYNISFDYNGNVKLIITEETSDKHINLTDSVIDNAVITHDSITFDGNTFQAQKITPITLPISLLDYNSKFELIDSVAEKCDGTVVKGYSGRFMYGKQCWGVITSDAATAIAAASAANIVKTQIDSMGLDTIVYWPEIEYTQPLKENNPSS